MSFLGEQLCSECTVLIVDIISQLHNISETSDSLPTILRTKYSSHVRLTFVMFSPVSQFSSPSKNMTTLR